MGLPLRRSIVRACFWHCHLLNESSLTECFRRLSANLVCKFEQCDYAAKAYTAHHTHKEQNQKTQIYQERALYFRLVFHLLCCIIWCNSGFT